MQGANSWRKTRLLIVIFSSAFIFFILSQQVNANMFDWFKKYDVHLSPAVHGKITLDGKPLTGATVTRELTYDKEYVDRTTTDADGSFSFPLKQIRSGKPGTMEEMRTRQVLVVHHQNKPYVLWYLTTSSIEPQQAVVKRLGNLTCELTDEEQEHVFPNIEKPDFPHSTFSICRWAD